MIILTYNLCMCLIKPIEAKLKWEVQRIANETLSTITVENITYMFAYIR